MQSLRSLKGALAADDDTANTMEVWDSETLDKVYTLRAVVEGLNWTVGGGHALVARLIDAELVRVPSFITAALVKSRATFNKAIYGVHEGFAVLASSAVPGPSAEGTSDQA